MTESKYPQQALAEPVWLSDWQASLTCLQLADDGSTSLQWSLPVRFMS